MSNYAYLHEVEMVELRSPTVRQVSELLPLFRRLGFSLHDDVVSLDRKETVLPWQHSSIVEVEIQRDGEEVFGFEEGEWDAICLQYLFASLPYALADKFIEIVFALSSELDTSVHYRGANANHAALKAQFAQIREELMATTGEDAGSEGLAILIHSTYPRR